MNARRMLLLFAALLAINLGVAGKRALGATPSFTISASNTTYSASGSNTVLFTVSSVNGYTGTVIVQNCGAVNPPEGARLPYCGGPLSPPAVTVPANGTVSGKLPLYPFPSPVALNHTRRGAAAGLALAGALLVGLGFKRRTASLFVFALLALGILAGSAGITACGGSSGSTLTPGVWSYTVSATDMSTGETASTTFDVTVPPGTSASM